PECGSETKKLISSAGLVFKGSGFYITDYSKKMKKPENSKAGGDKKTKNKDAKPGVSSIPKPTNSPTAQRSLSGVEGSSL
ncbi:MAG: hypothetical protein KAI81_00240, partial [Candidatus Marinimicrobia bacterium]|nr:hypothetical protein [Candidatus Neomarinimicrobiota bacterium]